MLKNTSSNSQTIKENVFRILPYGSLFLIFLGAIRLMTFYTIPFNLNIFEFIGFSEIIYSLLDKSVFVVVCFAFFIPIIHGMNLESEFKKENNELKITSDHQNNKSQSSISNRKFYTILTILFLLLFCVLIYKEQYFSIGGYLVIILIIGTLSYFYQRFERNNLVEETYPNYVILFFTIICLLVFATIIEVSEVKLSHKYNGVSISFNDSTEEIISDSKTYYIGKTEKYIFIYEVVNHKTRVIPMGRVKEIQYP